MQVALDMALLVGGAGFLTHCVGALPYLSWIQIFRLPELVRFCAVFMLFLRGFTWFLRGFYVVYVFFTGF